MPRIISGKRYAQAFFELALEKGEPESWQVGLSKVTGIVTDIKVMGLLENPKIPFDTKKSLLKERLGKVDPLVLNLVYLLMSRGKLKILDDIFRQYERLLDAHYGIEHAELITAVPLDDEIKKGLSNRFAKMVGHEVIIDAQTDPSVIGGFRARIDDTLIDGSIKNTLESLRKNLAGAGR
ncbi:MAG: ATP synthase F1 subunit delta [Deltaproteobacteria bacterium]|nr:ATP synthase F1 subunit delta [Deltaproteobacteria bacterium]